MRKLRYRLWNWYDRLTVEFGSVFSRKPRRYTCHAAPQFFGTKGSKI